MKGKFYEEYYWVNRQKLEQQREDYVASTLNLLTDNGTIVG